MRLYTLLILFFVSFSVVVQAQQQDRSDLEKRRTNLLNEIANTQSQLEATKKDKKATMGQLNALMAKLRTRQKLIDNINSELDKINGSITMSASEIQTLNNNLATLKMAYAQSIRYAYKHRVNQNMIAFLFSAKDFNDAIRRMQYLRKYRDYRKDQADKIRVTQAKLTNQINVLNTQKNEKGKLLQVEEVQKDQIQTETQQTNQVVSELKGREKELMGQIQSNQRTARKLEASIKDMIRKEIEALRKKAAEEARRKAAEDAALAKKRADEEARRKAQAAAGNNNGVYSGGVTLNTGSGSRSTTTSSPTTNPNSSNSNPTQPKPTAVVKQPEPEVERPSYKLSLTPEVQNLSNSFAASKGRLPWPVEKGFVSSYFGKHPHPIFPSVMIDNNGIDITTDANAGVRAIFAGTVSKVANIDGVMIMINHGEFFTIYTNLSGANVRVGDKVSAKQVIGRAGRNDEGDNMVNFQIWKIVGNNSVPVDPSAWIAR